jgi:hypothetical protein
MKMSDLELEDIGAILQRTPELEPRSNSEDDASFVDIDELLLDVEEGDQETEEA